MEDTIEKQEMGTNVRLTVPKQNHERAQRVKRLLEAKKNEDLTIVNIYLQAIELGLSQMERAAA